jgi:hypothetical protein
VRWALFGLCCRGLGPRPLRANTDDWFNDQLANANAGRTIGAADNIAEGQKALIAPEQQMAQNGAYARLWNTGASSASFARGLDPINGYGRSIRRGGLQLP